MTQPPRPVAVESTFTHLAQAREIHVDENDQQRSDNESRAERAHDSKSTGGLVDGVSENSRRINAATADVASSAKGGEHQTAFVAERHAWIKRWRARRSSLMEIREFINYC